MAGVIQISERESVAVAVVILEVAVIGRGGVAAGVVVAPDDADAVVAVVAGAVDVDVPAGVGEPGTDVVAAAAVSPALMIAVER